MSDTSNAPSTASGKAFVDDPARHAPGCQYGRDCVCELAASIRRIEDDAWTDRDAIAEQAAHLAATQLQEADTQLLTLREALTALCSYIEDGTARQQIVPTTDIERARNEAREALNSTAEYNKQALARIREEAPLDAAWKRAEAALPGGANLAVTTIRSKGPAPSYRARSFEPFPAHITVTGNGPTPVAALNALADALASQSKSDTE